MLSLLHHPNSQIKTSHSGVSERLWAQPIDSVSIKLYSGKSTYSTRQRNGEVRPIGVGEAIRRVSPMCATRVTK